MYEVFTFIRNVQRGPILPPLGLCPPQYQHPTLPLPIPNQEIDIGTVHRVYSSFTSYTRTCVHMLVSVALCSSTCVDLHNTTTIKMFKWKRHHETPVLLPLCSHTHPLQETNFIVYCFDHMHTWFN